MLRVDSIDQRIVSSLVADARSSYAEIGKVVRLSAPAVKRRVDRLLDRGILRGFTAVVNAEALGWGTEAFVEVHCRGNISPGTIRQRLEPMAEVVAAYTVSGAADAIVHLRAALAGKPLLRGEIRHPRLSTVDLSGKTVSAVRTVGKHLFLEFDGELSLHNHLGLDGTWQICPAGSRWRRPAHQARVVLTTAEHEVVGFLLHELKLLRRKEERLIVGHLGPDLLDENWSAEHVAEAIKRLTADPDRELGVALLDQRVMAGIGNVYKTEVCFLLGVSPWTPVSDVDAARTVELCRELLLRNANSPARNTTGDPRRGRELWVYGRTRTGCLRCGGPVRSATQGSDVTERVAYYCPHCQPGPLP